MKDKALLRDPIMTQQLEAALLRLTTVSDCVVRLRETNSGETLVVAYVVPSSPPPKEEFVVHVRRHLESEVRPSLVVTLAGIPLTKDGKVDEAALLRVPVIDSKVAHQWEQALLTKDGIEQGAVVIADCPSGSPPLHLTDVLPNWRERSSAFAAETELLPTSDSAAAVSRSEVPAISHGGALKIPDGSPTILAEALERAAREYPEAGFTYIQLDGSEIEEPYPALMEKAQRISAGLRRLEFKPGDKAIFQIETGQDFIPAFWGCVFAGVVPVPIAIARSDDPLNSAVQKLHNAWKLLGRPYVLTTSQREPALRSLAKQLQIGTFPLAAVDRLVQCPRDRNRHDCQPEDLALIFLTSGSTGIPKGVMQSHRSLLCMAMGTAQQNDFSSRDVTLNWMPLEHVGAISFLQNMPVTLGCRQVHVPIDYILQEPLRWLDLVDHFKASISWGPNFAFNLINERSEAVQRRSWDLSSMRFLVSAGELVVGKTLQRFLDSLAPHNLPSTAIHPAFGMSETCSGITWSDGYRTESDDESNPFMDLGSPIPSASIRIVDETGRVLTEGEVGRLQVKGPSVTSGYYENPELNQEVFTTDGWFDTGDLGFLRKGHLSITGRDKDEIIINGVNYVGSEIESVVETVQGVKVSYTAACAVRPTGSDAEKLAIFFSPNAWDDYQLRDLLRRIRAQLVSNIGISPTYLIPLRPIEIPKTDIGKIQRRRLKDRFAAGHFDSAVKRMDVLSENANTVPDWCYRRIWRRSEPEPRAPSPASGYTVVFLDRLGLGESVCQDLRQVGRPCAAVAEGQDFARLDSNRFCVGPQNREHYRALFQALCKNGGRINQIVDLGSYDRFKGGIASLEQLECCQSYRFSALMSLLQALNQVQGSDGEVRLLIVSSDSQGVLPDDNIAFEKASVQGLLKTIPREWPWLNCRHVDLPAKDNATDTTLVLRELRIFARDDQVAYRGGQRFVSRLEKVDLARQETKALPFRRGGMYVITGGLGGIGVLVARYLLEEWNARLLLLGRTVLPDTSEWENVGAHPAAIAERIEAYQALRRLRGEVLYVAVDVCDRQCVQTAVENAESLWHCQMDGVIHLAACTNERPLEEESGKTVYSVVEVKATGSWILHEALEARGGGIFIAFGSTVTFFGGANTGAYSAANSVVNAFCQWQNRASNVRSYCFEWTMWDEIGMHRGYGMGELLASRGYKAVTAEQGIHSLLAALHHEQRHLMIGLDGTNLNVRRFVEGDYGPLEALCGYFMVKGDPVAIESLEALSVPDRFGNATTCEWRPLGQMPLTDKGEIDREQLRAMANRAAIASADRVAPRTELERQIAQIWREVLGVSQLGIHDDFFALGGDSIRGAVVINKLQERIGGILHVVALFNAPTIAQLAQHLKEHYSEAVTTLVGAETMQESVPVGARIGAAHIAELRRRVTSLPPRPETLKTKNPRAIFVFAPPRSGTTLLRVILGGHPQLFAPPELYLLSFDTMAARAATFSNQQRFWREGSVRALMQINGLSTEEADLMLREFEEQQLSTKEFYRLLQQWLGDRILVDKTPTYSLDLEVLRRAESDFEDPLYIHLVRHPYGTIRSFDESSLDQLLYAYMPSLHTGEQDFSRLQLAELTWLLCHQNILDALRRVSAERQIRVRFEDLVREPRHTVENICQFLGLPLHPEMLQPYKEKQQRMTDGVHSVSRMLGDFKFHQHQVINADVADTWRQHYTADFLGDETWRVAESLGYERIQDTSQGKSARTIGKVSRENATDVSATVDQLSDSEVDSMLKELLANE
jgi:acyl-CoA synthetase (AMP-forming)/AMP-acid ligase II/NAD(P)-dependent dehydrogenase (short-subunit alcohol dehydrogenase family)